MLLRLHMCRVSWFGSGVLLVGSLAMSCSSNGSTLDRTGNDAMKAAPGPAASGAEPAASQGCPVVHYHLDLPAAFAGAAYCRAGFDDAVGWLTLLDSNGVSITNPPSCLFPDCGTCQAGQPGKCPPNLSCYVRMPAGGVDLEASFEALTTRPCRASAAIVCRESGCRPSGHYIARMCAVVLQSAAADEQCATEAYSVPPSCIDVPFDFPATTMVVGTISPSP